MPKETKTKKVVGAKVALVKSTPIRKISAKKSVEKKAVAKKPAKVNVKAKGEEKKRLKIAKSNIVEKKKPVVKRVRKTSDINKVPAIKTESIVFMRTPIAKKRAASGAKKTISNKSKLMQSEAEEIKKGEMSMQDEIQNEVSSVSEEVRSEVEDIQDGGEKSFIKWTGKSFLKSKEDTLFYKVSLAVALGIILWGIKDGSWLSVVTFLTLAVIIIYELKDEPTDIDYEINIDGISIGGRLYKFDDIHSFDIVKKKESYIVKIQLRDSFLPTKELHLAAGQDLVYMETLLEYFLPREAHEEMLFNFRKSPEVRKEMTEDEFIEQKVKEYINQHS